MKMVDRRLHFDLRACTGRVATRTLVIYIDGLPVWPVRGDEDARLEIQIDDLLAYLTDFWKPLMLRRVYPIDVNPRWPSELRQKAERRWRELPPAVVNAEEEAVADFEEAHDLSRAFAGIYGLPPFWMMRSGTQVIFNSAKRLWLLPFDDVRGALTRAGDQICEILMQSDEVRWDAAVAAWRERNTGDATGLLAWSTGLDRRFASKLILEGVLNAPRDFEDAANDNDELRIAARMAGALPDDQIREVISLARQFGAHEAAPLRDLSAACLDHIAERHKKYRPHQQGEAVACFVRDRLQLISDEPVPVFEIVDQLGIELRHSFAEPGELEGLAIWGARHGPGVFLNEASPRILKNQEQEVSASAFARVTLAHELCHLLLDGSHAMSAIEVLKSRMPAGVEQRAKSFAGEFLLPTDVARRRWHEAGSPRDPIILDNLVQGLAEYYQITRSVVTWKIQHAANKDNIDLKITLDSIVPWR